MAAGGEVFEYELPSSIRAWCYAQWSVPRDGARSVLLTESSRVMEDISHDYPYDTRPEQP